MANHRRTTRSGVDVANQGRRSSVRLFEQNLSRKVMNKVSRHQQQNKQEQHTEPNQLASMYWGFFKMAEPGHDCIGVPRSLNEPKGSWSRAPAYSRGPQLSIGSRLGPPTFHKSSIMAAGGVKCRHQNLIWWLCIGGNMPSGPCWVFWVHWHPLQPAC